MVLDVIDSVISTRYLLFVHMSVTDQLINTQYHVYITFIYQASYIYVCLDFKICFGILTTKTKSHGLRRLAAIEKEQRVDSITMRLISVKVTSLLFVLLIPS